MNKITFPLKPQMTSAEVVDLHQALTLIGLEVSDRESANRRYGPTTRTAVRKLQSDHQLSATGIVDEATANLLNRLLIERGVLNGPAPVAADVPTPESPWNAHGTVRHADGTPIAGVRVSLFNRLVGGEERLLETTTNDQGQYSIIYLPPAGMTSLDLFVRAYDSEDAVVGVSIISIGAGQQAQIDLTIDDDRLRGPSEFARTTAALTPFIAGADLNALDADDVALLVRKTATPRVNVTAWMASKRIAERRNLSHEAMYGLIRIENTALLPRLLKRSGPRLRNAIIRAANENLISRAAGDRAAEITGRLKQTAVSLSASGETPGSLGRLLATGQRASAAQQSLFINRYARHDGQVSELWRELRNDPAFGNAAVDDLQLSLQLGALTANHPPLVQALRSRGITRSSETASLTRDDWQALLHTEVNGQPVGAPANIKGATEAERLNNYTTLLAERAALAFPTAQVANALKTAPGWETSTAVSFFEANPQFNIKSSSIKAALASPDVVIKPEWDKQRLESELSATQRVARIAPLGKEASVASGLLTKGYGSAFSVSRQSLARFTAQTAASIGGEATAKQVHANAQRQVGRALSAFGLMNPATANPLFGAIGVISEDISTDATWASLFGAIDYCRCEHCRSIYSPAAYFVDLLAWLDGHQAEAGGTVFDLLDARRPDLKRIQLSCENTNTALPYVDLVNEILEDRVLNPSGADVPQGNTAISQELLANPEFLRPEVYDGHLSQEVFPEILPFDLWHELAGVYLAHLGVNRADLMKAMQRGDTPSADSIAAARLGLSGGQWGILAGLDSHSVWEYWGYSSAVSNGENFKTDLAKVSNFLDRARIEYDDLLDLLHSRFANLNSVVITGDGCDTDLMTLTTLTNGDLVRMNQFIRIWRNRGWTMLDLDKALHALGVSSLDPAGLRRLANLDRIQSLTKASLLDILSWWSPVDTFEDRPEKDAPVKSLYERVFLNRAVDAEAGEEDFPFALNDARDGLRNTVLWDDVHSQLQAALGINADEVSLLVDETVDGTVDGPPNLQRVVTGTTVTLDGLSALYRHVSLARALKAPLESFLGLLRLIGLDPFDVDRTAATVDFVEVVAEVRASDFSLDELHYLLEHDADAETRVGVTDETIGQTLVEIRDGLARIETEFGATSDPTGAVTSGYLAVLLDPESLATVMTALQTPEAEDGSNNADLANTLTEKLGVFFSFNAPALIHQPVERRFTALLDLLAPYLQETQGNALIIQKIATFSGRGLDSVGDLLSLRVKMTVAGPQVDALRGLRASPYVDTTGAEIVAADDAEAFSTLRRIHKAALALNKLEVDIDEQIWLFDVGTQNGLLNPVNLPTEAQTIAAGKWDEWRLLVNLFGLRKDLPGGELSLVELLRLIDPVGDAIAVEDTFRSELASRTGWLREDVDTLIAAFGFQFPQDWRDGSALRKLVDAFTLIRRAGASAAQVDGWVTSDIGATQAEEIRLAAKSKHDEPQWLSVARALRDPVREKQRAALVAYLIAQNEEYADEEDLYSDLLIDVEMSPCMLTSRIKQAISSVQLFIQRSFLNLEDGVVLTRDDRDQWEWMKNYRVWEAARKVFLYPENWIEPELRDDKSPLFERLENALLQGELTDESAEKAYMEYLEGLLRVARLEVMGMYHQSEEDEDGTVDILHVVARTQGHPREYYYRQWIDEREWTPWEKLDADIEADHIILAVCDRRLYLFWPMVVQKAEGNEEDTSNFLEMKLAWIERFHEQWGARKLSADSLKVNGMWDQLDVFSHAIPGLSSAGEWLTYFRLVDNDPLTIECRQAFSASIGVNILGRFVMDPCTGAMSVDNTQSDDTELVAPSMCIVQRMRFFLTSGFEEVGTQTPLTLMSGAFDAFGNLSGEAEEVEVLGKVPAQGIGMANEEQDGRFAAGTFGNYAYPHQYEEFASQHGVFLDDNQRTFHVMPEARLSWERAFEDDAIDPVIVGATESKDDVFTPPPKDEPFEPEFDWDKTTEPPIVAEKQTLDAQPVKATAITSIVGSAGQSIAFADRLTNATLQASQNQLYESIVDQDPFTSVMTTTDYRFSLFYHPYVCDFLKEVRRLGVEGLLDPNPDGPAADLVRQKKQLVFFAGAYGPTSRALEPYPIQKIDFDVTGAYSGYNWEVFFHIPLLIANRLYQNQRFEEARRWLHFIFDPTSRSDESDALRFWKIQPFYRPADAPIGEFLELASSTDDSPEAEAAREQYDQQVNAWLADPFNTHAIARLRTTAYQKTVVMKYLDNLIDWGDSLFRRDTIESINEATQLYVLALELLGERPDSLPPRAEVGVKTFEEVRHLLDGSVLNDPVPQAMAASITTFGGNPILDLENILFDTTIYGSSISRGLAAALWQPSFYFCIPPNEKLLGYWDLVEDRLFKIRHCMNIEGVVRQLPLFEPPIDPGMLVRARATGVDLASALADLNAPLPHYRFSVMLQKAYSLNQTVRSLGAALLSALEKRDAEELSRLRANQEVALLEAVRQIKKLAIDEARHSLAAAERSLDAVHQRRDYYQELINAGWLPEENEEKQLMEKARKQQLRGSAASLVAGGLALIPEIATGVAGVGPLLKANIVDGLALAKLVELGAQAWLMDASAKSAEASISGLTAGFIRRKEEWQNQLELSKREIKQIEKQIEAGKVRLALAEKDLENHERQIENARSVRDFMENKFTNAELYQWMVGQLSSLYFQSYQLSYDLAKKAERAYRHELALPDSTFIQFGYWDSLKKGLLAGERLQYDLERMDVAYLDNNRREYEITKNISLASLDPVALLKLTTEGYCEFSIPESLFDIDYPGHYLRRIKSVSVTIPCVSGPFTNAPCRLTLVSSRTRIDPSAAADYPFDVANDDDRFQIHTGAVESIVISSGREDAGLFSLDHRDERYLPFEETGAISDWSLKMTSAIPTFDWSTITDVVLSMRYTAREGGDALAEKAIESLSDALAGIPLRRAFSARREFPTEWNAFLYPATGATEAVLSVELSENRFPYLTRDAGLSIRELQIIALVNDPADWTPTDMEVITDNRQELVVLVSTESEFAGHPSATLTYGSVEPGAWTVIIPTTSLGAPSEWIEDLALVVTYEIDLAG